MAEVKFRYYGELDWQTGLTLEFNAKGGGQKFDVAYYYDTEEYSYSFDGFNPTYDNWELTDNGGTDTGTYRIESYTLIAPKYTGTTDCTFTADFYVTSKEGDDVYGYVNVKQTKYDYSTTIPIWQDIYYTASTDTLDYTIEDDGQVIYAGRAYVMPNKSTVNVDVSKICQDYLNNSITDGNLFKQDNFTYGSYDAVKTFYLLDSSGNTLDTYTYRYDWSYKTVDLDMNARLTMPINGHTNSFMIPVCTDLQEDEYYLTHPVSEAYPKSGYCGYFALYYQQRNGAYAAFLIEGNVTKTDNFDRYTYNMSYNNNNAEFEKTVYNCQIGSEWELHTGILTADEAENLAFNLIGSNRVWLHDFINDKIIPVIVSEESIDYKTFKNNSKKPITYTIKVASSQNQQNL